MASMLELGAALCAGAMVTIAISSVALPAPLVDAPGGPQARALMTRFWWHESRLVASAGWPWLTPSRLLAAEAASGVIVALIAVAVTGLPVLGVPGAIGAAAVVRTIVATRSRTRRRERQDAVLEAVRMLRQVLEVGAGSVQQAIAVLAERGPLPLRTEFRVIAATSLGRRQAWCAARDRVGEPLFDMLAAAVLIQGPGGGELTPLFAELESTVSGAQEVEREAEALQVQARSAAAIIVCLPIAFLLVLSALRSPYLDAFHTPAGEAFLLLMLAVMAAGYAWMRKLLRLEGLQRVRLVDA
jgi:tight adherence protein B